MTHKQQAFVNFYLGEARLCGSRAAHMAGYRNPKIMAAQLKKQPEIAAQIKERLEAQSLSSDEVLQILSDHARGTLRHFIGETVDGDAYIDLNSESAKENFHLLKKAKTTKRSGGKDDNAWEKTEVEIEIHDPQAAAVHVGRHYAMFTDRTEGNLNVGGVIGFNVIPPAINRPTDDNTAEGD